MNISKTVLSVLFSLFASICTFAQATKVAQPKTFRAAVVKINITPNTPKILLGYDPRLSTGIHDSIYHHIVALDDGDTPIRFLKINNDIAIWSAPLELFCEVSNEVRDRSPFPFTFYYGYTNGWLGYLPSEDQWKYGGYEVEVSPYTEVAPRQLAEAVSAYLDGEMLSPKASPPKQKKVKIANIK